MGASITLAKELLAGRSLFVNHQDEQAYLFSPKYPIAYLTAEKAVEEIGLVCVVNTTLDYPWQEYQIPEKIKLTAWQLARLKKFASDGIETVAELSVLFGLPEDEISKLVAKELRIGESKKLMHLSEKYAQMAKDILKEVNDEEIPSIPEVHLEAQAVCDDGVLQEGSDLEGSETRLEQAPSV